MLAETSVHLQRSSRRFASRFGVAHWINHCCYPRFWLAMIVAAAAAAGYGTSSVLFHCGLSTMALRFPLGAAVAYGVFLLLLRTLVTRLGARLERQQEFVRRQSLRREIHNDADDEPELSEIVEQAFDSADRDDGDDDPQAMAGKAIILMSITVVVVCVYFIWFAPMLLAEILVEGSLVAWLYRPRVRGPDSNWLTIALERTAIPAVCVAGSLLFIGLGLQHLAPGANTAEEALHEIQNPPPPVPQPKIFPRR